MRHALLLVLALSVVACGPKGSGTTTGNGSGSGTGDPVARDEAVLEGDGWTRLGPGAWVFDLEPKGIQTALGAEPGGRGMQRIQLPAGATGGSVSDLGVAYVDLGVARWSVFADGRTEPAGSALGSLEVTVGFDMTMGVQGGPTLNPHSFQPPIAVDGVFFLVFEALDGQPSVGAVEGSGAEVFYQDARADAPAPVDGFIPHLSVTLVDVH